MSCESCNHDRRIWKKRDETIRVTLYSDTENSVPYDLTGAKIWFSIKAERDNPDAEALVTKKSANNGGSDAQAKVVDAENGVLEIYIDRTDTANLDNGSYWYDVVIENSSGKRLQAIDPASLSVEQPVTVT